MAASPSESSVPTLSVLDQSPIPEGLTGGDALRNSIDLAQLADRLGYHRYWVAEHHATPALACTSPEILIGLLAGATSRIRVGSGGIMLPHYSPLKVAENFSMLSALYPGRIDLGIGRAPGTDQSTAFALQRDRRQRAPDDFPEQLDELLAYVQGRTDAGPVLKRLTVLPGGREHPEPWLLGSSPQSGQWASQLGLPYCFADFINPLGAAIAARYREQFQPGGLLASPKLAVAAWVICTDSEAEARDLASSFLMMMTLMMRGQLIAVPTVERAKQFVEEQGDVDSLPMHRRLILGEPDQVREGIEALALEYGADEVMLVNILHDHAARRRSYELVAQAFGLDGSAQPEHDRR